MSEKSETMNFCIFCRYQLKGMFALIKQKGIFHNLWEEVVYIFSFVVIFE